MTNLTVHSQFFHQVQKPFHRSGRFDAYTYRTGQPGIKLPHPFAFVRQSLVHNLSGRGVQHRQRLLASMQITSYNPHLGLLRSEHCWGEHRTVYSGRREADVVMTSIRSLAVGRSVGTISISWRLGKVDRVFSPTVEVPLLRRSSAVPAEQCKDSLYLRVLSPVWSPSRTEPPNRQIHRH